MCHKNSPATINMQHHTNSSAKAARRSRTRLRKPKFLSLRLQLSPPDPETTASSAVMSHGDRHRRKQSSRTQIHHFPETDLEDRDDENLAADFLFNGDDTTVTTLSGLLDGGADATAEMAYSPVDSVGSRADSVSTQLREAIEYGDRRRRRQSSLLLRAAMKGGGLRETDQGEEIVEKWVSYSEVVERKLHEDEVSSCTAATDSSGVRPLRRALEEEEEEGPLLRLKLDYEEVLNSWSNKGSLFINGKGFPDDRNHYHELPPPQCVPELSGESILRDPAVSEPMDGLGTSVSNIWAVPEDQKIDITTANTGEKDQDWYRQREASVMRYKEKRQNRLFDKRIRYQVRKLNAEKRPRIKGRFVRRSCEED